jgi:hypothetical protein
VECVVVESVLRNCEVMVRRGSRAKRWSAGILEVVVPEEEVVGGKGMRGRRVISLVFEKS